nr:biotin/lipoyl-binding protein [Thermoanaerobaculia bacterium]
MADSNPSIEDLRLEEEDRRDLAKIKTRRRIRLALVLLLVLIVGTMSLRTLSAPAVKVATAEEIVASNAVLQASGYVTARRKATVSSKFTGKVTEVLVEEGLKVTDGQILARLDDSQIRRQAELDEARL